MKWIRIDAPMLKMTVSGNFKNTERFLTAMSNMDFASFLESLAVRGVDALIANTPADSGLAASSWGYEIERSRKSFAITWTNHDVENGFPVAIMLQYGYYTGTGGYVRGRDYINPAIRPIFDEIADAAWKAVTDA